MKEFKDKLMGIVKDKKPELSEKEIAEKIDTFSMDELSLTDLEKVTGGGPFDRPELDPNKVINGWSFKDLHAVLCWTYESYHTPGEVPDWGKMITMDFADEILPSTVWKQYAYLDYPDFFEQPMLKIWCPNEYGIL